tara:strand:+ start:5744 stop:6154 length:411 start_codon:yes stop_codon:yes gene_type:complete
MQIPSNGYTGLSYRDSIRKRISQISEIKDTNPVVTSYINESADPNSKVNTFKPEKELFVILAEECGEVIQSCMKYLRWGMDENRHKELKQELGDVYCMIKLFEEAGVLSRKELLNAAAKKRQKLQDLKDLDLGKIP